MIVECPSCHVKFHLPDEVLGPDGRRLRCSRCRHVWRYGPPVETRDDSGAEAEIDTPSFLKEPVLPVEPLSEPVKTLSEQEVAKQRGWGKGLSLKEKGGACLRGILAGLRSKPFWRTDREGLIGYAAAGGILLVSLSVFVLASGLVTAVFPQIQAVYTLFEGGGDGSGRAQVLALEGLKVDVEGKDGQSRVKITGQLVNRSESAQSVPMMRVRLLRGEEDQPPLDSWLFQPPEARLAGHGKSAIEILSTVKNGESVERIEILPALGVPRK